jgi:glycosyltransferase involved in cell wall biosynthesis
MGEANDLSAVIEAARLLPDVPFVLMGDGKRRAELERSAPANVEFPGPASRKEEVAALAARSSACLTFFKDVPVLATNSPNKLFDTFAAGRPAIVNMDGWMREVVEYHDAGLYVPAGDAASLAEKLAWLRAHPEEIERMGRNGRALAERDFDRDLLAERVLDVLDEVAR